jgi:hypothetical protein
MVELGVCIFFVTSILPKADQTEEMEDVVDISY